MMPDMNDYYAYKSTEGDSDGGNCEICCFSQTAFIAAIIFYIIYSIVK